MDFGRKLLEKYGWTDGKGLGKNENGIAEALKPKLKRSVTGIGHDAASDFTEHWWEKLYDKASSNLLVEEKSGKTKKIKAKDKTDFEITNSTWKLNKRTKKSGESEELYRNSFVRTAVLTNGGSKTKKLIESESENEEKEGRDVTKLTDEELFAACGGRTAHKGARHGLRAEGKLSRIERQDKMLLKLPQYQGYSHAKNLIQNDEILESDLNIVEELNLNSDNEIKDKKKKMKRKHCINHNNLILIDSEDIKGNECQYVKKSEKKTKKSKEHPNKDKNIVVHELETDAVNCSQNKLPLVKNKKKKRKNYDKIVTETSSQENDLNTDLKEKENEIKNSKKGKHDTSVVIIDNCVKSKKCKKSSNKDITESDYFMLNDVYSYC